LALLIENFPGRRRGFGANMRGTLSLSDELTGEFRNEFDAMSISDLGLLRLLAGKLSPEAFGLLQHYRHQADISACPLKMSLTG
jgi:hypothetical protein